MTMLYACQSITIGSFTVTNINPFRCATRPFGIAAFKIDYDGSVLMVSGAEPVDDVMPPGCMDVNGVFNAVQCTDPQGSLSFSAPSGNPAGSNCNGIAVPAGWNLLSGTPAAFLNLNVGPLYSYRAGDSDYEAASPSRDLPTNSGYWAYFVAPTQVSLGCYGGGIRRPGVVVRTATVDVGPGWTMLGNPIIASEPATASGADAVYTYDPTSGYQPTSTIQPWQGAWVYSASGGTITFTSSSP